MNRIAKRSSLADLAITQIYLYDSIIKHKRREWITKWETPNLKELIETYIEQGYQEWLKATLPSIT